MNLWSYFVEIFLLNFYCNTRFTFTSKYTKQITINILGKKYDQNTNNIHLK